YALVSTSTSINTTPGAPRCSATHAVVTNLLLPLLDMSLLRARLPARCCHRVLERTHDAAGDRPRHLTDVVCSDRDGGLRARAGAVRPVGCPLPMRRAGRATRCRDAGRCARDGCGPCPRRRRG